MTKANGYSIRNSWGNYKNQTYLVSLSEKQIAETYNNRGNKVFPENLNHGFGVLVKRTLCLSIRDQKTRITFH